MLVAWSWPDLGIERLDCHPTATSLLDGSWKKTVPLFLLPNTCASGPRQLCSGPRLSLEVRFACKLAGPSTLTRSPLGRLHTKACACMWVACWGLCGTCRWRAYLVAPAAPRYHACACLWRRWRCDQLPGLALRSGVAHGVGVFDAMPTMALAFSSWPPSSCSLLKAFILLSFLIVLAPLLGCAKPHEVRCCCRGNQM
jgi:hypothetical protein